MTRIFIILFLLTPCLTWSQASTTVNMYTFGGLSNDVAEDIEATNDGGYIITGSTSSNSSGNTDVYLLKIDALCNYQWSTAIGGTNNDWGYSVKQTYDNGYIVASSSNSFGNGGYDAVLMKRDNAGNYQWRKTFGGADWDFVYSITQTYDSGYVFCGETFNNSTGLSDVYIVKTDSQGTLLWSQTLGGPFADQGNSVIETSDSNLVIAGSINTSNDSTNIYVIKLTSTGTKLWDKTYGFSGYETANKIIETSDLNYVLAGATTSFGDPDDKDFYLQKIDPDGTMIWDQVFTASGTEEAFDIRERNNGSLNVFGVTEAFGAGKDDAMLFVTTSLGIWAGLGPTFGGSENDNFKSATIGNNGDLCIAGFTNSFGNGLNDVLITRIDSIALAPIVTMTNFPDMIPLGINENKNSIDVNLYPNPANDVINISSSDFKNTSLKIIDITGKEVIATSLTNVNEQIHISNLENGIYFYSIYDQEGRTLFTDKLVINH